MRKTELQKKNIVLIGMMGAGKTTIGQALADALELSFVDVDAELEKLAGRKISQIFATDGEEGFRQLEMEMVARVAQSTGQVISTGGGVILRQANVENLQKNGLMIFLYTTPEMICQRLAKDTTRPLLQTADPLGKLQELYAKRLHLYRAAADLEVDTGLLKIEEVIGVLANKLELDLINRF